MAYSLLLARFSSALPLTAPRTAQMKQGSNDKQAKKKKKKKSGHGQTLITNILPLKPNQKTRHQKVSSRPKATVPYLSPLNS